MKYKLQSTNYKVKYKLQSEVQITKYKVQSDMDTGSELRFMFRQPPYGIGPNGRLHWGQKARLVAQVRGAAKLVALSVLRKCVGGDAWFVPRVYDVVWFYSRGVEPDADNVVGRCKPILDGCADAFGVDDRWWRLGEVRRVKVACGAAEAGHVVVVFHDEG